MLNGQGSERDPAPFVYPVFGRTPHCSFCTFDGREGGTTVLANYVLSHYMRSGPRVTSQPEPIPFAAQAIPFTQFLDSGQLSAGYLASEYVAEQFVERLAHYILSVHTARYTIAQLSKLLEQPAPKAQVFFFKCLKETSPEYLKDFAPCYYGFMNEFNSVLFT